MQENKITKREQFLNKMEEIIPWTEWITLITPYYPNGSRGRLPCSLERILRMYLLQTWFHLSDEGVEDAIYDSLAMRKFLNIEPELDEKIPDATTLCKFRKLLNQHGIPEKIFAQVKEMLSAEGKMVNEGTIVDATIVEASSSKRNARKAADPEMHSTKKNTKWYFGLRSHIGTDALHGFVHSVITTPANTAECKVAPQLIRPEDEVVYGDAAYLKTENYVTDGISRDYRFNIQQGTFKRHHGDGLAWKEEKLLEQRKSSVRCKIEYVFHIVKDIFKWRKARYKGIYKNHCHANLLYASANLYMLAYGFQPAKG